ncbi:MAG: methionyl-tRNA formyltransferase [Bacteriovoracaceae bacterium]|nr:methionyl-tRNA formyltransferase [Bacteriovoracaceae bacterium]
MKKLKTIFMGTPDIALDSLSALMNHPQIEIVSVISMPDRPAGRGHQLTSPEVIQFAKNHSLPYFQTTNINQENEFLEKLPEIDLIIVFAFAQFLGKKILQLPKLGCFNIHTSLLPKYRGAAPIQYALLNDDKTTGVSIQKMVKKMDAGDIAHQTEVSIMANEKAGQLYQKLKTVAATTLTELLDLLVAGKVQYQIQDESQVSFAPTLSKDAGHIHFAEATAKEIICRLRAFDPWPGIYCFLNQKRLKILELEPSAQSLKPGVADITSGKLIIGTKNGSLRLKQIQLEGKKACEDIDLLNGIREKLIIT